MADQRLRELHRRARQTGAARDEARYLQEALRAGLLDEERLRLAAYLGHPGACEATGEGPPPVTPAPRGGPPRPGAAARMPLERWGLGLDRWGQEVTVRAGAVAARLVLPRWDWQHRTAQPYPQRIPGAVEPEHRPRLAIESAEAWALEPSPARALAAREARAAVHEALEGTFFTWVMDAAVAAAAAAWIDPEPLREPSGRRPIEACLKAAAESEIAWRIHGAVEERDAARVDWDLVYAETDALLREAIARELVPWALGAGDPVRMRAAPEGLPEERRARE